MGEAKLRLKRFRDLGSRPLGRWLPARQAQFGLDLAVLSSAFFAAYLLRFEFRIPEFIWPNVVLQWPVVVGVQFATLAAAGVYSFIWRYVSLEELGAFFSPFLFALGPILILRFGLPESFAVLRVPVSVIIMDALLGFSGVIGLRLLRRVIYERYERRKLDRTQPAASARRTLLVGAGRAGGIVVREIFARGRYPAQVVGFVDDASMKQGALIHGVRVLGTIDDIPKLVAEHDVDDIVITISDASPSMMKRIVSQCESTDVRTRVVPGIHELADGSFAISRIRDVQIEDLLGRDPVSLETEAIDQFLGAKTVMVTGAGGSIGSELCRQLERTGAERLLLVERAEPALFEIQRELGLSDPRIVALVADVQDEARMEALFRTYRPDVVFHAAAHKHVPLMEHHPDEAVANNVRGTKTVAELAGRFQAASFVLVSTDKAVRPTSVMGSTKRVAELICQDLDQRHRDTRYVAVRFGNVLGSNGSVIPIFRDQLAKGEALTVTDPKMTRYFMTIPEAAQLVLQAGSFAEGGEIFILDMGEPVRILELAEKMISLSGLRPYEDVPIHFTGIRPGEKLFEELHNDVDELRKTRHPKIFVGNVEPADPERLNGQLMRLLLRAQAHDAPGIRAALREMLPESSLSETEPLVLEPPRHRPSVEAVALS